MTPEGIFFYIFATGAVLGSLGVLTCKQPINSAISLVVSFFFLSGIYILLNAQFMAVVQILVYAGAIMVLFMFVLMLLNLRDDELGRPRVNGTKLIGSLFAVVLFYVFATASLGFVGSGEQLWTTSLPEDFGLVAPIGRELMTKWILPFELAAVLLLVGIVGAVVVAKRRL
jgi:NADH-quinone oxidoreductase subunit J